MKIKEGWIVAAALAAIAVVSILAYRHVQTTSARVCMVCERETHPATTFHLTTEEETIHACCPRCELHYALQHPDSLNQSVATDANTLEEIAAESAYYVEGGDVEYCTLHQSPVVRTGQPAAAMRSFDRCLPNLVAFRTQADAQAYQASHGGGVLTYDGARESVRER